MTTAPFFFHKAMTLTLAIVALELGGFVCYESFEGLRTRSQFQNETRDTAACLASHLNLSDALHCFRQTSL